jgi:single-strand DNA-binding protein
MSNPTITIIGRIGTDPEFRSFSTSENVKFRVITSDRRKNENGIWEDVNTSGWNIVAWGKLAESCKDLIEKGQEVFILGSIKEDTWSDKDGNQRKTMEVNASSIAISTFQIQKAAKSAPRAQASEQLVGAGSNSWDSTF